MKLIPFIAFAAIMCSSCAGSAGDSEFKDIITLTDNGRTYADTVDTEDEGGIALAAGKAVEGNAVVQQATAGRQVQSANAAVGGPAVQCAIHKKNGMATFSLLHAASSAGFPFSFSISGITGPASGVGIFKGAAGSANTFAETGMPGGPYAVDSVVVNVTKADGSHVTGNYSLWVRGAAGSKTVSGTINCGNALIDGA